MTDETHVVVYLCCHGFGLLILAFGNSLGRIMSSYYGWDDYVAARVLWLALHVLFFFLAFPRYDFVYYFSLCFPSLDFVLLSWNEQLCYTVFIYRICFPFSYSLSCITQIRNIRMENRRQTSGLESCSRSEVKTSNKITVHPERHRPRSPSGGSHDAKSKQSHEIINNFKK